MDSCIDTLAGKVDFKCPVCLEIPAGRIFQCDDGHIVCEKCDKGLVACPVCRQSREVYPAVRVAVIEKILDLMAFDCRYKEYGCNQKVSRKDLSEHQELCEYR